MQGELKDLMRSAVDIIKSGGTVVYPTETVYGLGADAFSGKAVREVYRIKRRELSHPISLAVSSFEMMHSVAYIDSESLEILTELLPGPLMVLLRKKATVPAVLTAGSDVVGVRFPDNEIANQIINETGPLTSTSANISGRAPPTSAEEVEIRADIIINGGRCKYGMPSTILDMTRTRASEGKRDIQTDIKRRGAGYDRVLHVLRSKADRKGLHGFPMP